MSDAWCDTLQEQEAKIRMLADWASLVNEGACRDHLRAAAYCLQRARAHREALLAAHDLDYELPAPG